MFSTRTERAAKSGVSTFFFRHRKLKALASWLCIFQVLTWTIAPAAFAGGNGIVTDGRTSTTLSVRGRTTDIHTRSVHGRNAYNSFSRFGVGAGNTVNLHVPGQADNLINLVRENRTDIHGTLNGVKNGKIGGNIYLLNPHGIVVGPNGTVNAGSLSLQTPTSEFVDGVLDANGVPNSTSVGRILNGSVPIGNGRISIQGQINTLDSIYLRGGGVDVSGALRAGSAGVKAMRQQVNLGGLVPAANTVHRTRSGAIVIGSPGNVRVSGRIDASGEQDVKGGTIDIRADGNIDVEDTAIITARGFGANSDGGDIVIYAGDTATLAKGALIDASSADTGVGGFIEFSAINVVSLDGGRLVASSPDGNTGIIYIDPATVSYTANTTLAAGLTTVEATEKIEVAANITVSTAKSGDAIIFRAPAIIMNAGSKVTTKHTAGATTTYGDITFETKKREGGDLVIPTDAAITITNATIEGKDIVLDAQSINKSGLGKNTASSNLTLTGATITGESVTIQATSEAEASILSTFDSDGGVDQTPPAVIMDLALVALSSNIAGFPLKAVVGIAEASANVNVNSGTVITATGELTIQSESKSTSNSPSYTDLALTGGENKKALPTIGVVYASTRTTSTTNVASGATLNAGDKVEVKATTESSLDANNVTIVNSDANLGITIGQARTTTTAKVEKGATINLTNPDAKTTQTVEVAAENSSEYNAATNTISTTEGNNAALSATWLDIEETVKAELGASLTKADGVTVSAKSEIAGITAAADAGTGDPGKWDRLNNALQSQNFGEDTPEKPVHDAFFGRLTGQLSNISNRFGGVDLGLPFQLAGTLSVADAEIDVDARITAPSITTQGAKPADESDSTVGDVSVTSAVELGGLQNIASGGAEDKEASNTAIAFAVPITTVDITNQAIIDAGVSINASESVSVEATTERKYELSYTDLDSYKQANTYLGKIGGDLGLKGDHLTSGGFSVAKLAGSPDKKTVGVAANIDLFTINSDTLARIGGLQETGKPAPAATSVTAKSVDVKSSTTVGSVHVSGNVGDFWNPEELATRKQGLQNPSGGGATLGGGVTYNGITYDLSTIAEVGDNVTLTAVDGVNVAADSKAFLVNIGASGMADGQANTEVGVLGVVLVNILESDTIARVGSGSTVTTSGATADMKVTATDHFSNWNVAGGVVQAENVGIGASVGVNLIELNTIASIDGATKVEAKQDVEVKAAQTGGSRSFALAAAIGGTKPEADEEATDSQDASSGMSNTTSAASSTTAAAAPAADPNAAATSTSTGGTAAASANEGDGGADAEEEAGAGSNSIAASVSAATGKFGITVAGDAAVNVLDLATKAEVKNVTTLKARDVKVDAANSVESVSAAGAFSVQSFKDPAKPKSTTIGIAGAYAHNAFKSNRIEAVVQNVTNLTTTRNLLIDARNTQSIISGAASGSAQAKPQGGSAVNANIAGAVTFNTFADSITLAELSGSSVTSTGDVAVKASDTSTVHTGAGAVSLQQQSSGLGMGASASINISDADTKARIVNTTIVSSKSVKAEATSGRSILSLAISVAAAGSGKGVQAAGAVAHNSIGGSVLAELSGGSVNSTGAVNVLASEKSQLITVAGDASVGGNASVGVAVASAAMLGNAHAKVSGTTITSDTLAVKAVTDRTSIAIAIGAAVSKDGAAFKGSVVVNLSGNSDASDGREGTIAEVDGGAKITATGDVEVAAAERNNMHSYAGGFAGGKNGVGAAVAVNKAAGEVTATLADATVLAADDVRVRAVSGANDVNDTSSRTQLIAVAVNGAVATQGLAISGAAVVNKLDTRTTAEVKSAAKIGTATKRVKTVTVRADDRSVAGSGALGFSYGTGSFSAALAVDLLDKRTTARLAGATYTTGDVLVDARSSQAAYGGLVSLAVSGQTAISLAAAIAIQKNITLAEIANNAIVHSNNNVHVNAEDKGDTIRFTTAAGLASVQSQESATTARIGDSANVTALASGDGVAARTGGLTGGVAPGDTEATSGTTASTGDDLKGVNDSVGGTIATNVQAKNSQAGGNNTGAESVDATAILGAQTAATDTVKGVVVTANSDQRMINLGLGVAGSTGVAGGGAATVSTIKGATTAEIGRSAKINQGAGTAGADQDVVVRAKTNGLTVDTAVGVAAGSSVGVGAGVDVVLLEKTTTAKVGKGALVTAKRDIKIEADNRDTAVSVTTSLAVSGEVGVSGAVGVTTLKNKAQAYVEDATSAATAARLSAGGDLSVVAKNRSDTYHLVGSAGIGVGTAGAGVGVSVIIAETVTHAEIGNYTIANIGDDTSVSADADTRLKTATIAFGAGTYAGLAGAVGVKSLKTDTKAEIGSYAQVNQSNAATATDNQTVSVTANDRTDMLSVVGAAGVGAVGFGAGVDVITMRGSSTARIANNAKVRASEDVIVDAQLRKTLDGYTVAAGIGPGAGVGGAVMVVQAGGNLTTKQRSAVTDGSGNTTADQVSGLTGGSTSVVSGGGFGSGSGASSAKTSANSAQQSGNASADIIPAGAAQSTGNDAIAEIGDNATVAASRDVTVNARNVTEVDLLTGGLGISLSLGGGGVGVGAGLAFVDVNTLATARVGAGAAVTAGRNMSVTATDGDATVESTIKAFAGAAGGTLALGAAVADFDFTTTTRAEIGNGAVITVTPDADTSDADEKGKLTVSANEVNNATVEAYGATVSGGAAVGAQIADIDKRGSVTAEVVKATTAAGGAKISAGAIDIAARHGGTVKGRVYGATVGLAGAFAIIDLDLSDDVKVKAKIGDYAQLTGRDQIKIETTSAPRVDSKGYGGVAGGAFAVGVTDVEARADISSIVETGKNVSVSSDGEVSIVAKAARPGTQENVEAEARTGSGSLGVGVTALEAKTVLNSDTATIIGADNDFQIGKSGDSLTGRLDIGTSSDVAAETDSLGVAIGGIAVGAVKSNSTVNNKARIVIGAGSGGTIEGRLQITSLGKESLDTRTVGGAGGLIAGASAKADNSLNSTVTTTFADNATKDGFTSGDMTVSADHADGRVLANTDARAGYLVGKTGAYSSNAVNSTVKVDVGDKVELKSDGTLLIEAKNKATKVEDGDAAFVASGGVAGGAATRSTTQFKNKVDVIIGAADIRAIKDDDFQSSNDIIVRAYSNTVGKDTARLDTGGAVAIARAESVIKSGTSTDRDRTKITLADNGVIWSEEGDVSLGARTDANISAVANAKTYGLAGAAEGISESRIFADNAVELGAGARIYAEESIAVRSGADDRANGSVSTIARTRLWNRTVIPFDTDPKADAESNIASTVKTKSGARISAVRNIEMTANTDGVKADGYGRAQDLYQEALAEIGSFFSELFGGGPVTLEDTYSGSHKSATGDITLTNTEVKAGFKHNQILEIAENPTVMASPDPRDNGATIRYYTAALDADGKPIQSEGITYQVRNNVSLETTLRKAITDLQATIDAFSGDAKTKLALQNDMTILQGRYNKLVGSVTTSSDGTPSTLADVTVDYVIVDDVTARSGDVTINAQKLNSTGGSSIIAPGDTKIEITNNSAAFLQLNDLTIPEEQGGRIFFNGALVDSKAKLDTLNGAGATTAGLSVQSSANTTPTIKVTNKYGSRPADGRASDLVSTGNVYNPTGSVNFATEGNLDVSGSIRSATISLSAGKDFTSSFTYGFKHTGGLPRAQFNSLATPNEGKVYPGGTTTASASSDLAAYNFHTGGSIVAGGDVYISAERVNVNGLIQSGIARQYTTIDAAKGQTIAEIEEAYAYYADNQTADWNSRPDAKYLFGACYQNCSTLRQRATQAFYNAGKPDAAQALAEIIDSGGTKTLFELVTPQNVYVAGNPSTSDINQKVNRVERQVGANYNVVSNEIEVNNAVAEGGRVQIFGELLSTGGGQINVLDGFANIDIRNDTSTAVVLHKVDTGGTVRATETGDTASGRQGRVRLIDPRYLINDPTGKKNADGTPVKIAKVVDYVRENGLVVAYDNTTVDASGNPSNKITAANATSRSASVTPTPSTGFYGWTTGQSETDEDTATYRKSVGQAFGLDLGAIGDLLSKDPSNLYSDPPPVPQGDPKPILIPIDTDGDGVNDSYGEVEYMTSGRSGKYTFEFERKNLTSSTTKTTNDWCSASGWIFGCFERTYQTVVKTINGNQLYYRHSVPATQQIGLGFIGYDTGNVNIASVGDVHLNASISNASGTTNLTSTAGSVLQRNAKAVTTADVLNVTASSGAVGGEGAVASLTVDLVDKAGSRVNVTAGKGVNLTEKRGSLRYQNIIGGIGNVVVASNGSITQTAAGGKIQGHNVTLTANAGAIGSTAQSINIETNNTSGVFNATAAGDVNVTELTGDLRVEKIKGAGNVKVTVESGSLLDANANDVRDTAAEAELLAIWNDNALLDGTAAQASRDLSIAASTQKAKDDYAFYWSVRTAAGSYKSDYAYTFNTTEKTNLTAAGYSAADIAALEAEKTATYYAMHGVVGSETVQDPSYAPTQVIVARYKKDGKVVPPTEAGAVKVYQAEAISGAATGYAWSAVDLKNGISRTLISSRGDTSAVIEDANIEGRDITINVKAGQIGETKGTYRIEKKVDGSPADVTDELKIAIASAERDDFTFGTDFIDIAQREDVDIKASGDLDIRASSHVFLGSEDSDLNIVRAKSDNQDIRIKTGGAITNGAATGVAAVEAKNLILEASGGSIGTKTKALTGKLSGKLTARSIGGDVYFNDQLGDLDVDFVLAGKTAGLTAAGSILDTRNDADHNILAGAIDLNAATNIGSALNAFDIKLTSTDGVINATASSGSIWLNAADLDLRVATANAGQAVNLTSVNGKIISQAITATAGAVNVTSSSDIALGSITAGANVVATAANGRITQADGGIVNATGDVTLTARNDITIANIQSQSSAGSAIAITSTEGAIIDGGDAAIDLVANTAGAGVTLSAKTGIGNTNALETQIATLSVTNTGTGAIGINEQDALTIAGLVQAGGDISVDAKGALTVSPNVSTTGQLTLASGGALTANGSLTGSRVAVTSAGNATIKDAVVATAQDIVINSGAAIDAQQALTAERNISLTSGLNTTVGGNAAATNGALTVDAGGSYQQTGNVAGRTGVSLTSGAATTVNGNVSSSDGAVTADAGGALSLTGNVSANNDVTTASDAETNILGAVTSTLGKVKMAAAAGLGIDGSVDAATAVDLDSGDATTVKGSVTADAGDVTITAGHLDGSPKAGASIDVDAVVNSNGGAVTLTAGEDITIGQKVTANNRLTAKAARNVTINSDVESKTADIEVKAASGAYLQNGNVTAKTGVDVESGANSTLNGNLTTTNGPLSIDAGNGVAITGIAQALNDVMVTAVNDISVGGSLTSQAGRVDVQAGGAYTQTGNVTGETQVDIESGDSTTVNGSVTSNAGGVMILAGNPDGSPKSGATISVDGSVTGQGGTVELTAGEDIAVDGAVTARDQLKLAAARDVRVGDPLTGAGTLTSTAADVKVTAGNEYTQTGDVTSETGVDVASGIATTVDGGITSNAGGVKIVAGNADGSPKTGASIWVDGSVTGSDGKVSLTAGEDIGVDGTVSASDQVKLAAARDVTVGGTLTSTAGDVDVTATSGSYLQTGDLIGQTGVSTTSGTLTSVDGKITSAAGAVDLAAGTSLTIDGTATGTAAEVSGATGVTTSSGTSTSIIGTIKSTLGKVLMTAAATLGIEGSVSGETGVETASGDATTIKGSVTSDAGGTKIVAGHTDGTAKTGASISVEGSVTGTGGAVALTAGEDITVDDAITALDQLKLAAARNVRVGDPVTGAGSLTSTHADVKVTALSGSYKQTGDVVGKTGVAVMSGASSAVDGDVTSSDGPVSIEAGDDITVTGAAHGKGQVKLTAANDVTVGGTLTSTAADVKVTATSGSYNQTGDLVGQSGVTTTSGTLTKIEGKITSAAGAVNMAAGTSLTVDGSAAGTAAEVSGATGVTTSSGTSTSLVGTIKSTLGKVQMTAATALDIDGSVSGETGVDTTSGNATAINGSVSSNAGGITILAGNSDGSAKTGASISVDGSVTGSGGAVALTAGEDIGVDGTITARDQLKLAAARNVSVGGTLTSTAADVKVTATSGFYNQTGDLVGQAGVTTTSGTLTKVEGKITSAVGAVDMSAGTSLTVDGTATGTPAEISGATGVTTSSGTSTSVIGAVESTLGKVKMTAATSLGIDGSVSGRTGVETKSGDATTIKGSVTSTAGGVTVVAGHTDGSAKPGASITVDGSVTGTGGAVALRAGEDIAVDGAITARDQLKLAAARNVRVGDPATGIGSLTSTDADVKVTATSGSYTQSGNVDGKTGVMVTSGASSTIDGNVTSSDGPVSVDAGDNITVTGAAQGKGQVKLTAANDVTVGGDLTSTTADVEVTAASGAYEQTGDVAGHTGVATTSGTLTKVDGTIKSATGAVNMAAGTSLTIDGTASGTVAEVSGATGVTTTSGTSTTVIGTIKSALSKVLMTAATALGLDGNISGETGVETASGDATAIKGSVTSNSGGVKIVAGNADGSAKAGASISIDGSVTGSGGLVSITAGEDIDVGGTVSARDQLRLTAANDVTVDGKLTSQAANVKVTATSGNYTQTGDVSGNTGVTVATGANTNVTGNVTSANGAISVVAGDSINVTGNGTAKQQVLLTAANDVTVDGKLTSTAANVKVTATSGNYTQTGDVSGNTGVTVATGANTDVTGNVTSANGAIMVDAGDSIEVTGDSTAKQQVMLTAANDATVDGKLTSQAANVKVTATSGNYIQTGDVSGNTGVTVATGANTNVTGSVTSANGAIMVDAGDSIDVTGNGTAKQQVMLTAANDATVDGKLNSTAANVKVTATSGNYTQTGDVSGNTGVTVATGGNTNVTGNVTSSNGAISVDAGDSIDVTGNGTAKQQVMLTAANDVTVDGKLTSQAANVKVTATSGNYTQTGDVSGNTGVTVATGANTNVTGNVTSANGAINVAAGNNINVTGNSNAKQRLIVTAANNVSVNGDLKSNQADVKVTATSGQLTHDGNATSLAGIVLTSGTATKVNGQVRSTNGALVARAGTDFELDGSIRVIRSSIQAARDVKLNVNPLRTTSTQSVSSGRNTTIVGSLVSGATINLLVGGHLDISGNASAANDITARADGNAVIDADVATTRGKLTLRAGNKLDVDGTTLTRGRSITMTSGGNANVAGLHQSLGGEIRLTGGNDLTLDKDAKIQSRDGTITLTANGGGKALGNLTQTKGAGEINARDGQIILRAGNIQLDNPLIAGTFQLRSTGRIELSELKVKNDIEITGKQIVIGELIHTGTDRPLLINASAGGSAMADLVDINATSQVGVQFGMLASRVARIHAQSELLEFLHARIGERAVVSNARFQVLVDNTNPALQQSGVQLHQVRAGEAFFLVLDSRTFSTEVDTLNIDRTQVTRVNLPGQPFAIQSDDVTTHNGIGFSENLKPLEKTEADLEQDLTDAGTNVPEKFVAPFSGDQTPVAGTTINVCERSNTVNVEDLAACQ